MNYLMVVDDEEGVRRSLRKVLAKDGYEVITAETGEEALKIVADRKLDLKRSFLISKCRACRFAARV